jgi:hypothetical protein
MDMNLDSRFLLLVFLTCGSGLGFASDVPVWQKTGRGIYEAGIKAVAVHPHDDALLYAATSRAVYKSVNQGMDFLAVFQPRGEQTGINFIYIAAAQPEAVYAATDKGLYQSLDAGEHWQSIYYSSDEDARVCRSVLEQGGMLYLGTGKGLFMKPVNEKDWRRAEGELGQAPIEHIKTHKDSVYIATDRALFRGEIKTSGYQQVFSAGAGQSHDENGDPEEDPGKGSGLINFIEASGGYIFVVSSRGLYVSADEGRQWRRLTSDHVPLSDLTALLVIDTGHGQDCEQAAFKCLGLLAGTKKGAFLFKDGGWKPIYEGMETNRISHLAKDARNTVYAATDRGVFHLALNEALPSLISETQAQEARKQRVMDFHDVQGLFDGEPGIGDVHRFAIEYAEVSPEKIKQWRRLAQRRAWLPDLDVGVDSASDWSRSSSIWGSYTSGGQHYVGPDDKARGGDFGWDVALSWDLGDLVYSSEQTTIDSRSKLMVELREDILDQVTRLYFERRRIQAELAAAGTLDPQMKVDKEMRVAELTALLDAFTGGEFSRRSRRD